MKMSTREMTTAEVVDSPTPLAPPVVVKPQEQLTCSHQLPISCAIRRAQILHITENESAGSPFLPSALTACNALGALPDANPGS